MLKVFVGFDPREQVAWHVCVSSIMRRATKPVMVCPIALHQLGSDYKRPYPIDEGASTEFAFSRFLTPYLAGFEGVAVFLDADMLVRTDISELEDIAFANLFDDVLVVKHDYHPIMKKKFLGRTQTDYPCKNWSSVMVFNCHRTAVRSLTRDYVSKATPMDLHQFRWANSVGELPPEWNHLVGEYNPNHDAKIVHYTRGTPCFEDYKDCEFSDEWREELDHVLYYKGKDELDKIIHSDAEL